MTILWRPWPRGWEFRFLKTWAAERPSFNAVSAVTGSTLAVPRTPSVPKIFFCFIEICSGASVGGPQRLNHHGWRVDPLDADIGWQVLDFDGVRHRAIECVDQHDIRLEVRLPYPVQDGAIGAHRNTHLEWV